MGAFRILVADGHPIVRFGLCLLLRSRAGWDICGEATDGRDAVEKCRQLKPDLLILDICMPELNGVDAVRQILKRNPDQVILVLTSVDSEQVVRDCLEAGIRGWVLKSDATEDLTTAVEAMQRRKSIFSSRVSDLIMDGHKRHGVGPFASTMPKLSPREREVVQLVSEGKASKEIATILNVTLGTAETHRSNILRKLQLHSIAELVLYAVRNEIVHVQSPNVLTLPVSPALERNRTSATSGYSPLPRRGNGVANIVPQVGMN
jgi:DNA-binding NarL/FixJ family response regulator